MPVPKGFKERAADFPASKCAPGSFRVKVLSEDKRLVICCPRGSWKGGRCRVGTRATRIQTKVSGLGARKKKGSRSGMYGRKRR